MSRTSSLRAGRFDGWRLTLGATVVALAASFAQGSWAQAAPAAAASGPAGHHHRMPMGGMHGPHGGMFDARRIDHMLDGLNATDAQRAQIKQIAAAAQTDLKAQHEAGRALHEKQIQIFAAPTVDANAAEAVRAQLSQQHDQVSRRTLTAMLDISRVLTPEQRAKIAERMKQRGDAMRERMQRMERERPAR